MTTTAVEIMAYIDGVKYDIYFERQTTFYRDPNYGADADGRRGVRATFVDDDEAEDVCVDGIPVEKFYRAVLDEKFRKAVWKEVHDWMNEHDPKED